MSRPLWAAAILGLLLRLAFSLGYWTHEPLTRDEREYLSLARGIAAGRGFVYDADVLSGPVEPFGRAPGYPVFLALVGGGHGVAASVPTSVKIAQSLVGALGVVAAGLFANRLAGPAAGRAAAFIAACYPPLVWVSAYAYSEALVWPLGLALAAMLDARSLKPPLDSRSGCPEQRRRAEARVAPFLVLGLFTGAAMLIRPAMTFFAALGAGWLATRRSLVAAAALAIGAAMVVAPWTFRNYVHEQRLIFIASEGGVTFWTGNHPLAIGEGDFAANPELSRQNQLLRAAHPGRTEAEMEPVYYEEALAWIREHPARWLALELRKAFYLVVPVGPSYRLHSVKYFAASVISYAAILPAALVGVWRLRQLRRTSPGLIVLAGSAVVAALVFFPQERFRIPALDPVLIVCAGAVFGRSRGAETVPA